MMLNNVNDTLDNAQIQRGTFSAKDVRCHLKSTIEDVVRVIEMQAASKNVTIRQMLPQAILNVDRQRVQ
jgi:signal transduction histidine kinase